MKISRYILFQLFGWLCFALFNIYVAYITQELTTKLFFINLLLSIIGLVLSHVYRNYILKKQWVLLSTEKLIQQVLSATIVLSILYNLLYYFLLFLIEKKIYAYSHWQTYIGSFISVYILFSIWNLFYFAWQYIEKNKRIQIETLKMESSFKDLEIKTIRSHLQPHFIFNSLNSIRALIDENPQLARDAITKISNILRNTITKQEATDSLQNELALVDDYLALEKIRFEERLHVQKNIAPNTLTIQIPTMMLQTLIENAIKHGISMLEHGGNINVTASILNEKQLCLTIENDTNPNLNSPRENSLGFGLRSSKQRLQLLYGDEASLTLLIHEHKATVKIVIPIKT